MTKTANGHEINQKIETKLKPKAEYDKMLANNPPEDFKIILSDPCNRFDELKKYLYLTSIGGLTKENLIGHDITMIISAVYEWPIIQTDKITSYRVPVDDGEVDDISIYFDEVSDKIHECHESGGNCVVHCMAGASRSTTLVLAYLMKYEKMPLKYAYTSVRKRRRMARPNLNFWIQLIDYEMKIRKKKSVEIKTDTVEGIQVQYPDILKESQHKEFYDRIINKQLKQKRGMTTQSQKQFNEGSLKYESKKN